MGTICPCAGLSGRKGRKTLSANRKTIFLFIPERSKDPHPPIAVFTDGYAFHSYRIDTDMAQRRSLLASEKYLIWSLSYQDVKGALTPSHVPMINFLDPDTSNAFSQFLPVTWKLGVPIEPGTTPISPSRTDIAPLR